MSNIEPTVSPWDEQKDHTIICRYCGNQFQYFLDFLKAHAPDCPWVIAYMSCDNWQQRHESMSRQFHRRQLLIEKKD